MVHVAYFFGPNNKRAQIKVRNHLSARRYVPESLTPYLFLILNYFPRTKTLRLAKNNPFLLDLFPALPNHTNNPLTVHLRYLNGSVFQCLFSELEGFCVVYSSAWYT